MWKVEALVGVFFNQEKALEGAFSVLLWNIRELLFHLYFAVTQIPWSQPKLLSTSNKKLVSKEYGNGPQIIRHSNEM